MNGIKAAFRWRDFQPLTVARRTNGDLAVVDGQHRLAAATELGLQAVPCLVYPVAELAEEAQSFVTINRDRKQVTPIDLWHAALVAGDPDMLAVDQILDSADFVIARQGNSAYHKPGELGCVQTIVNAHRTHGDRVVRETLKALHEAYQGGGKERPIEGALVAGVVEVFSHFTKDERFDRDRFVKILGGYTGKQWGIAARPYIELHRLRRNDAWRAAMIEKYNHGLQERNRLPKFNEGVVG